MIFYNQVKKLGMISMTLQSQKVEDFQLLKREKRSQKMDH